MNRTDAPRLSIVRTAWSRPQRSRSARVSAEALSRPGSYHHVTRPVETNVPANLGGHGVLPDVVIGEVGTAGRIRPEHELSLVRRATLLPCQSSNVERTTVKGCLVVLT